TWGGSHCRMTLDLSHPGESRVLTATLDGKLTREGGGGGGGDAIESETQCQWSDCLGDGGVVGPVTTDQPNQATPQAANDNSCLAQGVVSAIPGAQLTGGEAAQGGHEEFNIVTTPDQLAAAGFSPY